MQRELDAVNRAIIEADGTSTSWAARFELYANEAEMLRRRAKLVPGFTYDTLSEIRSEPFWAGLAAPVVAGTIAVVALASGGQPVQAGVPSDELAIVAPAPIAGDVDTLSAAQ